MTLTVRTRDGTTGRFLGTDDGTVTNFGLGSFAFRINYDQTSGDVVPTYDIVLTVEQIPEPGALVLVGAGLLLSFVSRRRR